MATRWSAEERNTFKSLLADGVELNLLKQYFPNRTLDALHREAQKYGYGVKTVNGVKVLYFGKKTRNRKKKTDVQVSTEATKTIVGEPRTVPPVQEPTTSEKLSRLSDDIVANNTYNSNRDVLKHLYDDIDTLLSSEKYPHLQSISVTLKNTVLTVSRGAS